MAEPVQAMTVREVEIEGKRLPSHTVVWVWRKCEGQARIEYEQWRGLVPLRKLDPCFGVPDEAFDVVHADSANDFEIVRCRAHDRRFLRDTRGSIGWYTVLTLLRGDDRGSPEEIWRRYHALDDSLLRLEGRSL